MNHDRLADVGAAFAAAVAQTSPQLPVAERVRLALAVLPEDDVREVGRAARQVAGLARDRLRGAASSSAASAGEALAGRVADLDRQLRRLVGLALPALLADDGPDRRLGPAARDR